MNPCDNCMSSPAVKQGLCLHCLKMAKRDDDREPDDREATDDEVAAAEVAWENWRTSEPI